MFGYINRMNANRILNSAMMEGTRPKGTPSRRWIDDNREWTRLNHEESIHATQKSKKVEAGKGSSGMLLFATVPDER